MPLGTQKYPSPFRGDRKITMKRIPQTVSMLLLIGALAGSEAAAQVVKGPEAKKAEQEITSLLKEFLDKVDAVEMHDRFWAEDLIYTSGMGAVRTKADILKSMRAQQSGEGANIKIETGAGPNAPSPGAPCGGGGTPVIIIEKDKYSAEDITVRSLGEVALLNFRLVQRLPNGTVNNHRNSGTLVKRNGKWQVVNWQATRVADAPVKKD